MIIITAKRALALSTRDPVNSDLLYGIASEGMGRGQGGCIIEDLAHTLDRLQFFRRVPWSRSLPNCRDPPVAVISATDGENVCILSPFQTDYLGRDLISSGSRRKHIKSNKNATIVSQSDFDTDKSRHKNF